MAWHFFDFGLLMPALIPEKHRNAAHVLGDNPDAKYDLQIRVRLREHLEYFLDNFMEDGTYNPEIHATPEMDYNYRAYTTVEAYAEGVKQATLKIDYVKFKDSSDRYPWNKKYHSILTSIWSKLCDLNTPGGIWGPKSAENPKGYDRASKYEGWGSTDSDWYEAWHNDRDSYYPTTFGNVQLGDDYPEHWRDTSQNIDDADYDRSLTQRYVTGEEYRNGQIREIIEELDSLDIPMSEWWRYTSPREFYLLKRTLRKHFNKKAVRSWESKNKALAKERVAEFGHDSYDIMEEDAPVAHPTFSQTMDELRESVMQGIDKEEKTQKAVIFVPPKEVNA